MDERHRTGGDGAPAAITGTVASGLGEGASFTQLPWAREQFVQRLGIDPHPGTLNLRLEQGTGAPAAWAALRGERGTPIRAPAGAGCDAVAYRVRIGGCCPGAVILPQVPGYPGDRIELIAAVALREHLALADGERVSVSPYRAPAVGAVIFDLDGTLVDTVEAFRVLAERAASAHGLAIRREQVLHSLNTGTSFWDAVLHPDHPERETLAAELVAVARQAWPEVLEGHARPFAGVEATLAGLRAAGARLGLVTGSGGESLALLEPAGRPAFEAVVTAAEVSRRKPHPEGLHLCLERLGVAARDAVYVGDTPLDVEAGRAAGMATIGVLTGAGTAALLAAAGADAVAADHSALPGLLGGGTGP